MHRRSIPNTSIALVLGSLAFGIASPLHAVGVPRFDRIAVVILENHSYDQVRVGTYISSLMASSTSFDSSYALAHPSHPNYLALWSGSLQGTNSDACPAPGSPFTTENLGHACETAGISWLAYEENLPSAGYTGCVWDSRQYTRSHAPWADFANLNHSNERPFSELAAAESLGTLPVLTFVIPNKCNSMHDCPVASGDAWLASQVPALVRAVGPNGLVVVTWDEDDDLSNNHILTIFCGAKVLSNHVSTQHITHYTVLRTLCDALGLTPFAAAATQTPITDVWLDTPGSPSITLQHPNGGESYTVGALLPFQWSASPSIAAIRVELSRTGSAGPWETVFASTPNDGAESWTVTGSASDSCWARLSDTSTSGAVATSVAAFRITPAAPPPPATITLQQPNGGESYTVGALLPFQWSASPSIAAIRVELSRTGSAGPWVTVFASTPNDGAESWTVTGSASDSCWARLSDTSTSGAVATSAAAFRITPAAPPPPATISLQHPNGGESYTVGALLPFQWSASPSISALRVELSRTGSAGPWETVFASTPNDGAESWTVTGSASDSCWARLSDTSTSGAAATSAAAFHLAAAPPPPAVTRINFQPATAPTPTGYRADAGAVFDATRGYGWNAVMPMKARSMLPGDPRDTFADAINNKTWIWEFAVPNGSYLVSVTCGDLQTTATNRVALEGQLVMANVATSGGQFTSRTDVPVTVADGRLTMTVGGNGQITHTKVDYITIGGASGGPPPANQPPSVVVVSPASDPSIGNAQTTYPFSGTASDPENALAGVEYRVRAGTWQAATGTSSWNFTASGLAVGPNLVEVRSRDVGALYSTLQSRTVTRAAPVTQYTLSTTVSGSGSVSPSGGTYASGAVVQITASPATGWSFSGWSGDLSGAVNPTSITMNANRSVTATFTPPPSGGGPVVFEAMQSGGSTTSNSAATGAKVAAASGRLYLAAISSAKPGVDVSSVSGLGLTWSLVRAQCAGRGTARVEVWAARGSPAADGIVTATLAATPASAVIAVCRYSGVDATTPIVNLVSSNTVGLAGACTGGTDNSAYATPLPAQGSGGVAFAAVALRSRTHAPGTGITERAEVHKGSGLSTSGVAVEDAPAATGTSVTLNGTLGSVVDWALVAFEIQPQRSAPAARTGDSARDKASQLDLLPCSAHPNPFNPVTTLRYRVERAGLVNLAVFDVLGRRVAVLVDGPQAAGTHETTWSAVDAHGRRLSSGVYFCELSTPTTTATTRLILLQ